MRLSRFRLLFVLLMGVSFWDTEGRSNCFLYALKRLHEEGGYIVLSQSRHGWALHASWTKDGETFYTFVPVGTKRRYRVMPPLWYHGVVETSPRLPTRERRRDGELHESGDGHEPAA